MAHAVEKMMYVGETPWHGLGTKLEAAPTIAEGIIKAGLNWSVEGVQLQMPDGQLVDRWAAVRSTDRKVLGTVGPGYHFLQNAEAFQFFQPFVDGGLAALDTAGSLRGGSRIWVLAKLNRDDSVIVAKADDRVAKYVLLAHGHDGSLAVRVGLTPVRVVCQNTLGMAIHAEDRAILKVRHTASMEDTLAAAQKAIEAADKEFEKSAEVFRALAKKKVTSKMVLAYIEKVFGQKVKAKKAAAAGAPAKAPRSAKAAPAAAQAVNGAKELGQLLALPVKGTKKTEMEDQGASAERAVNRRLVKDNILHILESGGRGLNAPGVKGTGWAVYNAVTEYCNWERGGSADSRMQAVWFNDPTTAKVLPAAIDTFLK